MYGFIQRGNSRTEYYEEVKVSASKSGKCHCGKKLTRKTTFMQTISPFNKNADGTLKDRNAILAELHEEAQQWKQEPCRHTGMEWSQMPKEEKETFKKQHPNYDWPMICGFRRETGIKHEYKK